MNFHEVANVFPLLQGVEFETLCQDIKTKGLIEAIWLHPDGRVIDGRNRYLACQKVDIAPRFRTWDGQGSLIGFVLSLNLHRRHLTSGQRAVLALEVEPFFAVELEREKGGRPSEINKHNTEQEKLVEKIPPVSPKADKTKSRDEAAKATGTNGRYVSDIKRIKKESPRIFEQVKTGDIQIQDAKRLNKLPEEIQSEAADLIIKGDVESVSEAEERITRKTSDVVRVNAKSNNVWYTPKKYIHSARNVLKTIDLDPASNEEANKQVGATVYFDESTDGLSQEWSGRIWLNPPYGRMAADFVSKLVDEYKIGNVSQAILLINSNTTDTIWFKPLWDHTLCFTDHRINFLSPNNTDASGSTHGSLFIYFGNDANLFKQEFEKYGAIVRRMND